MLIRLLLLKSIVASCCASVIIKSGVVNDEAQQQHNNANNQDVAVKFGAVDVNSEGGYDNEEENRHVQAQDAGKYLEENADQRGNLDKSNVSDEKFHREAGGSIADFGNKEGHKKGHHKSGFSNTYRKDESGSNSSYYDDSNNEGGEFVQNSRQGTFGDRGFHNNEKSHLDNNSNLKASTKQGGYNNGEGYNKDAGSRKNFDQENYYNNRKNQDRVDSGNQYGSSRRRNQEKYHQQETPYNYYNQPQDYYDHPRQYQRGLGYVNDYYDHVPYDSYNLPEKKKITIYEDPRSYDETVEYTRGPQNDHALIELEYRRSPFRTY